MSNTSGVHSSVLSECNLFVVDACSAKRLYKLESLVILRTKPSTRAHFHDGFILLQLPESFIFFSF